VSRKLTLNDISDLRAYENERPDYLARIIDLKKRRRVSVGPFVTFIFENRETMRFQIQEMARAEKMIRDEQIREELDIYNPLIPDPGELSATMMIELRSNEELREWLPKLVGIERSVSLQIGDDRVTAVVDKAHADQLTREDVTSSVHYVRFRLSDLQIEAFARETVTLAIDHPSYVYETPLAEETKASLLEDLRPDA
jgi:hypothetical protein